MEDASYCGLVYLLNIAFLHSPITNPTPSFLKDVMIPKWVTFSNKPCLLNMLHSLLGMFSCLLLFPSPKQNVPAWKIKLILFFLHFIFYWYIIDEHIFAVHSIIEYIHIFWKDQICIIEISIILNICLLFMLETLKLSSSSYLEIHDWLL